MVLFILATLMAGFAVSCFSGAHSAPCPFGTVAINVRSPADVHNLADAFNCTGQGAFNVTWYSNLTLVNSIKVADMKQVTVTGSGSPTIRGGLGDDNGDGSIDDPSTGTRIFYVSNGSSLRLRHLVLEGGQAEHGGAIEISSSSSLFVFGCSFSNNNASRGGSIYASNSTVDVDGNSSFNNNSAIYGGAIYAGDSEVHVHGNSCFFHNTAAFAGGAVYAIFSNISTAGIVGFHNNWARDFGGAVSAYWSEIYADGSTKFANNSADLHGGAVDLFQAVIKMNGMVQFINNRAKNVGGAARAYESDIAMDGIIQFASNSAQRHAGGVFAHTSVVNMTGSVEYVNNSALYRGGAVLAFESSVFMDGTVTFTRNSAGEYGGAMYIEGSSVSMDGAVKLTSNSGGEDGGGVCAGTSVVNMTGSIEYVNNSAINSGGAVIAFTSSVSIDGAVTFTNNSAGKHGGGLAISECVVNMNGSIEYMNNVASISGGAMFMEISDTHMDGIIDFANNLAGSDGGALLTRGSNLSIHSRTQFANNWAGSVGGGLASLSSDVYIYGRLEAFNNSATRFGGAMATTQSTVTMDTNAYFAYNRADFGGAFALSSSTITIAGSKASSAQLLREAGSSLGSNGTVVFFENVASSDGGALHLYVGNGSINISSAIFKRNEANSGGAVYVFGSTSKESDFSSCTFDGNSASDGGAVYLYTGTGVDRFTASVFRDNFAKFSGGAIFHTGYLRVSETLFLANEAGIDGPAVMSIGNLDGLSNVSFFENSYRCRAGDYSYTVKNEDVFCADCFYEVCARCSTGGFGVITDTSVQVDGLPVCEKAPPGATASSSGTTLETLVLDKGYYRTSNQSHVVIKCHQTDACTGGTVPDTICAVGYRGPYCAVCAEGFASGVAYSCRECSGSAKKFALALSSVVGLAMFLLAGLLFWHMGRVANENTGESMEAARGGWGQNGRSCRSFPLKLLPVTAMKIVVTVWQIIYQFAAIAGQVYPEVYANFVFKLTPINLDIGFMLSYSCLVTTDFYDHLLIATIMPPILLVALVGSYYIGKKRNCGSEFAISVVKHRHQSAALLLAFWVYSPVSYKIFQTFACDRLDDGNAYLRADYSLECSTALHNTYKTYAWVMLSAYPLGIPALFSWYLVRYRGDLANPERETMPHLKPLTSLWAAYKPSRYWFELVECTRRIALTGIAAFVFPNSTAQVAIVLLVAVAFVFISECIGPFKRAADANLYRWGNGVIVTSLYVAFLLKVDLADESEPSITAFSGVLIAANAVMIVAVLMQTGLLVREWRGVTQAVQPIDTPVRRSRSL